jgi:hypothetical protein
MSYYRTLIQNISDPYLLNQVAHYPFDTNANDLINAYNGTSSNMNYANVGVVANCATFNGTSSSIQIPNPTPSFDFSFGTGSFSINFWIFRPTASTNNTIFSKRDALGNLEWQIALVSSTIQLSLYSLNSGSNRIQLTSSIIIPADVWTMVTLTFAGGTSRTGLKCYLDSTSRTVTALVGTYTSMSTTTASLWLGRQGNVAASWFNGRLDQLRIWKGRELNQTEITDIYNTLY